MITPSFSLTATERVLPKLALDFTTAILDPRITFTRTGNTATYTNSSGVITAINANLPRFDYDPVTLVCKGLLIEESRINQCAYSESIAAATGWTFTNCSATANQLTAPNNQNQASLVDEGTATAQHYFVATGISFTSGTTYTASVYAKTGTAQWIQIPLTSGAFGTNAWANFDIVNGIVGNKGSAATSSIQNVGNGWYRCSITAPATATIASAAVQIAFCGNTDSATRLPSTTGTNKTFYVWGGQVEAGAFPTSYIPTTSAALTRNADLAVMTGTNFSSWYNQSEGAIVCKADRIYTGNYPTHVYPFNINDNTTSNEITVYGASGSVQTAIAMATGGVNQLDYAFANWTTDPSTMGLAYKQNSTQYAFNSSAKTTDTSCSIPTVTQMTIGRRTTSGYWNGHIQKISYWPQRLTSAELSAFTK